MLGGGGGARPAGSAFAVALADPSYRLWPMLHFGATERHWRQTSIISHIVVTSGQTRSSLDSLRVGAAVRGDYHTLYDGFSSTLLKSMILFMFVFSGQ